MPMLGEFTKESSKKYLTKRKEDDEA